jgi:hypothetical protein
MAMTQNVWSIKESIDKGDKNFIVLSLRSLGRADLTSVPAGSTRANKRAQQIKSGNVDFTFNGSKSSIKPSGVPLKSQPKQAKPAKAGKPRQSPAKVASAQKPSKAAQSVQRPLGFSRKKWESIPINQRQSVVASFKFIPPKKKSIPLVKSTVATNVHSKSEFGVFNTDWEKTLYAEPGFTF